MKLYLLKQTDNLDIYDVYDSCIVCAENEDDAKTISPNWSYKYDNNVFIENEEYPQWYIKKEGITCEEIGEANENIPRGVVIASYNAG